MLDSGLRRNDDQAKTRPGFPGLLYYHTPYTVLDGG